MRATTQIGCIAGMIILQACQLQAGGVVQGSVKLPAASKTPPALKAQYQIKPQTSPALPDPPTAIIYLEGGGAARKPVAVKELEVGQKHLQFLPGTLVVQKGTRVKFPNYDNEYHNVLSYSRAKEFDLGRYRKEDSPPTILFDKVGVVELNCEIHEHMRGYIVVVDTPYFTKTNAQGEFKLEEVPSGSYTLKVWINPKTVWQKPVTVSDGTTNSLNFP